MTVSSTQSKRIRGLDGLRACAVLMVFLQHKLNPRHFALGAAGVYLFFVLSGFLIFGILRRERARILQNNCSRREALMGFLTSRAFRIFPIYYLSILAVWLLSRSTVPGIIFPGELPWHLAFSSDLWVGWVGLHWTPALSHFWSLAVEEQFYVLAAPIVLLGVLDTKHLCGWFVFVNVLSFIVLYKTGAPRISILTNPLVNFGLFAMGGLLHELDAERWRQLTSPLAPALLFATFLLLPFVAGGWAPSLAANVMVWTSGVLMALLIYTLSLHQNSATVRLLEWKPLAGLGRISYGFYVYHYILSAETLKSMTSGLLDVSQLPPLLCVAVLFIISVIASRVSWTLVEAPAFRMRDRVRLKLASEDQTAAYIGPSISNETPFAT